MTFVGPLQWEAPECLQRNASGLKEYSYKSDVWSFAVTLYEMFARQVPYAGQRIVPPVRRQA